MKPAGNSSTPREQREARNYRMRKAARMGRYSLQALRAGLIDPDVTRKRSLGRAPEAVENLKDDQAQRDVHQDGAGGGDGLKRRRRLEQHVLEGGKA